MEKPAVIIVAGFGDKQTIRRVVAVEKRVAHGTSPLHRRLRCGATFEGGLTVESCARIPIGDCIEVHISLAFCGCGDERATLVAEGHRLDWFVEARHAMSKEKTPGRLLAFE
jgi:hypothetical protein